MPNVNCQRFVVGPAGARPMRRAVVIAAGADVTHCDNYDELENLLRPRGARPTAFTCEGFGSIKVVWYPLNHQAAAACLVRGGRVERLDIILYGDDAALTAKAALRESAGFDLPPTAPAVSSRAGYVTDVSYLFWREPADSEDSADVLALIVLVPIFCQLMNIE